MSRFSTQGLIRDRVQRSFNFLWPRSLQAAFTWARFENPGYG